MKWRVLIFLAALHAAPASEAGKAVELGRSARAEGIPQGAISELKRVAKTASGGEEIGVLVELARCLLEADREPEAAAWLDKTIYRNEPEVIFWRAQARAQKGDYENALADYTLASGIDFPLREDAAFGRGRMLEALGRPQEALTDVYAKVSRSSRRHVAAMLASAAILIRKGGKESLHEAGRLVEGSGGGTRREEDQRRYLRGRLALESGDAASALNIYKDFAPRDRRLAAGVAIGETDALSRLHNNEKAESVLEGFVRENPSNPLLGETLAKLDEVRARQKEPSNSALKQWEHDDGNPALSAAATYYLARSAERQEQTERALRNYREFIKSYPQHPLRTAAIIRLARLLLAAGQTKAAGELLSSGGEPSDGPDQARLRFLQGEAQYQSASYAGASKTFVSAANLDPRLSESALANAAISAISAGNEPLAAEILNALRKQNAGAARRIELVEAFQSARAGNPDSAEQLAWLADHGGTVGNKARLALAEWRWQQHDAAGAKLEFRRVANSKAAGANDQKDYFAVYLADDGSVKAVDSVSSAAQDFLRSHPDSPREADVRMKWGEVLMRAGDYRGARVRFGEAAQSADDPALKQSALFLEARAAAGTMDEAELNTAISILEDVALDKTNPLAPQARLEQAMLQSALGHPKDSVTILDNLIGATNDPRLKFMAQMKKGEALLLESATEPARAPDAIQTWRAIAADPQALPAERNEALTRMAAACAQVGDTDGALAAYYEALTAPRDRQPEYFWYYKAGFEAANLLYKLDRFQEAAAIYEKMAAAPGPRAAEAKERVKSLRLQKFIWED